jgi:MFS family permease
MTPAQAAPQAAPEDRTPLNKLRAALITPVRAMRLRYLPLLMIYYAYGALGLVAIAQAFWVKEALSFSPAQLAAIGVWLTLPWTIKMVFGQLADSVPIFGSQRRIYVFIGASLVASGMVLMAGAAGDWITFASKNALYVTAQLLIVIGVVMQDVIADAMTTEVVARTYPDGTPKPKHEFERELGLVQVLGRLALWSGILSVSGLSGWLAQIYSYQTVFLLGLIVPVISVTGALLVRLDGAVPKPIDWRILGGGLVFGAVVLAIGLGGLPFGQELIFLISLTVIGLMLYRIAEHVDEASRKRIFYAALVIFFYRSAPGVGEGYRWFTIDVLGFDEAFYGTLAQIGAGLALAGAWLFSDVITRKPIAKVLLWLTVIGTLLALPNIALTLRVDQWTEAHLGFGARTIAIIDTTTESPFAELSMIPALTIVALNAPEGRRATWFALMASLMNVALVAGQLQTKYLNYWFQVGRGSYAELPALTIAAVAIGFVVPVAGIIAFGKRAT